MSNLAQDLTIIETENNELRAENYCLRKKITAINSVLEQEKLALKYLVEQLDREQSLVRKLAEIMRDCDKCSKLVDIAQEVADGAW